MTYAGHAMHWIAWGLDPTLLFLIGVLWLWNSVAFAQDLGSDHFEHKPWVVSIALVVLWVLYKAQTVPVPVLTQ